MQDGQRRPPAADLVSLYTELLVRAVSNTIYQDRAIDPWHGDFDPEARRTGRDWPAQAHSMAGHERLNATAMLVRRAVEEGVPGDVIETGVWRGGVCILMRGLLNALGEAHRLVFCADSFDGLPPPDLDRFPQDARSRLHLHEELAVTREQVAENFRRYGLLGDNVRFLEGWFKNTLPTVRDRSFALIRLDGDMYESTMDGLENLYDSLSPGGFVVVDDYGAVAACAEAVQAFRQARGIDAELHVTDWTGVWWRKPPSD